MALAPMLKEDGRLQGDLTDRLPGRAWAARRSSSIGLRHGGGVLRPLVRGASAGRRLCDAGGRGPGPVRDLAIAGPRSRELLAAITGEDVSNAAMRFMSMRRMDVGPRPLHRRPGQLHRRPGLRDLDAPRIPARGLRSGDGGGEAAGAQALRSARAQRHAAGEELRRAGRGSTGRSTARARGGARPLRRLGRRMRTSSASATATWPSGTPAARCACGPSWSRRETWT